MNRTNLLLTDKPIANPTNSYRHQNSYNNQRSSFHDLLSNQVIPSENHKKSNTYDGINQLKRLLNQINSSSEEGLAAIKALEDKLLAISNNEELVEFDDSLVHQLLLAFIKNDYPLLEENLTAENLSQLIEDLNSLEEFKLQTMIDKLMSTINLEMNEGENLKKHLFHLVTELPINGLSDEMKVQLQQLLQNIAQVFTNILDDSVSSQATSRLLAILEQWSQLSQVGKNSLNHSLKDSLTEEEFKLWDKLSHIFSKRMAQQNKGSYRAEALVTSKDVGNWLEQLMAESLEGQAVTTTSLQDAGRPMTQIEQYVVHVQPSNRVERVSQDLMQKMTQIIEQSQFTKPGSQTQQLSLMIRPENLGNMTLHFTQMNGEMIVKIMVSSQMAREMLESNIHQLKHLFAPHQVVIERDTTISDDQFFNKDYEEEQSERDELAEEMKDDRDSNDKEESDQIDFESLLQLTKEGGL